MTRIATVRLLAATAVLLCLGGVGAGADEKDGAAAAPRSRDVRFTYASVVRGLEPGQKARVWLPVPPSNEDQKVTVERRDVPPGSATAREPKYGNEVLYFEAAAGPDGSIPLSVTYRVVRREIKGESRARGAATQPAAAGAGAGAHAGAPEAGKAEETLFLQPDAYVPVGPDTKPMKLVAGKELPDGALPRARVFYDAVNAHMVYAKPPDKPGWGRGDADWACDSRFGNCSDFHSLFISLARSHRIPAKFEMGFPLPEKRGKGEVGGYHCWAFFKAGGARAGWVPVDISEANKVPSLSDYYFGNLTEDRIAFSVGRDVTLVPKQEGPPLNFFIYPHVEVEGKPWPAEKVERKFTYEDLAAEKAKDEG